MAKADKEMDNMIQRLPKFWATTLGSSSLGSSSLGASGAGGS